jgi:hypothetical protein
VGRRLSYWLVLVPESRAVALIAETRRVYRNRMRAAGHQLASTRAVVMARPDPAVAVEAQRKAG